MQKILQFFRQPFPYLQKGWQLLAVGTLCVFTVLSIILNFVVEQITIRSFVQFVGGYTAITAICLLLITYVFPVTFKHFFDRKRWTKGKYFLYAFTLALMICVGNALYNSFYLVKEGYFDTEAPTSFLKCFKDVFIITFMIGVIPTFFGYFWIKNRRLDSDLQEKEDQNQKLIFRVQKENITDEKIITLSSLFCFSQHGK